jgi:hypothetical protein
VPPPPASAAATLPNEVIAATSEAAAVTDDLATTVKEIRTPTSDYPTIETSSEPAAVALDELGDASAELAAEANDYAAVNETELLADEARDPTFESSAVVKTPVVADQTPQPSESDIPDFRPRKRGRVASAAIVAGAAAIVVAGVGWSRFARHEPAGARLPANAAERAPERAPAPPSPAPAPSLVAAATTVAPSTPAPALEPAVATSVEKAPAAIIVTVKTFPQEAVIFRAGKRIGAGVVEVSVERNVKERLRALHDGYLPSNVVVDGSRDAITIRLKRIPKPRAEPPPQDDSPYGDAPSADATTTSAPAATAAPTATAAFPTGTTPQPAPDVSSTTASPE